jgi:hypothetical protein
MQKGEEAREGEEEEADERQGGLDYSHPLL